MVKFFHKKNSAVIYPHANKGSKPFDWLLYAKRICIAICLIIFGVGYVNWPNWLSIFDKEPIKSYALTHKAKFTTNEDIRGILAQEPQLKGYFAQDIQDIKLRFLKLPWVKDIVVRKIYPNRLGITLVEYTPVAVWNDKQLVSDDGVVFELPAGRFDSAGLPYLYGLDSEAKNVLNAWHRIKKDLESRNMGLKAVARDDRGSWIITLVNGLELKLGRGDWLSKMDRFVAIFPHIQIPEGKRLAYVDLRYEHGASVGFRSQ